MSLHLKKNNKYKKHTLTHKAHIFSFMEEQLWQKLNTGFGHWFLAPVFESYLFLVLSWIRLEL